MENKHENRIIKMALCEQHRNTRHDAVEKMNEIRARWAEKYDFASAESMFNEITGAIINLKQREPEFSLSDSKK